jgi:hypothetical protein
VKPSNAKAEISSAEKVVTPTTFTAMLVVGILVGAVTNITHTTLIN